MSLSASEVLVSAPEGQQWVVFHARPRCEKKIEALSRQRPARMYLPCVSRVHTYGGRIRTHQVPLFRGYVFGLIHREDRPWFRSNHYVANLLEVVDEGKLLDTLRAVDQALRAEMNVEVLPFLAVGRRVRVVGGPLKGLEAMIADIQGRSQVILALDLIQQTVSMAVDAAFLQPVD